MRQPELVIFVGLQGARKSTFYRTRFAASHDLVSKDRFCNNRRPARRQHQLIETSFQTERSVVVDSTNPTVQERAELIALGRFFGVRVVGYYFESRLEECLERNRQGAGKDRVPDVALYATPPSPPPRPCRNQQGYMLWTRLLLSITLELTCPGQPVDLFQRRVSVGTSTSCQPLRRLPFATACLAFLFLTGCPAKEVASPVESASVPNEEEQEETGDDRLLAQAKAKRTDAHGDPLPPGAIIRLGTTRQWQGGVRCVAFSPEGKYLASGGEDKLVHLWELGTGKQIFLLEGHSKKVLALAFSPDGQVLASAGGNLDDEESPIFLWDVATGKQLRQLRGQTGQVFSLAFDPGGKILAAGSHSVCLWEVATGKELPLNNRSNLNLGGGVSSVAYSPDGKFLAVTGFGTRAVVLLDLRSGTVQRLPTHTTNCPFIGFSPDGKYVASAGGDSFRLFDVITGEEQRPFGDRSVAFFAFAPEGKKVAWCDRGAIHYGDLTTGKETRPFVGHQRAINRLAFSPDGRRLASGSHDGTVLVWDATGILREGKPQQFNLSAREAASAEADEEKGLPVPEDARVYLVLDKKEYFLGENIPVHFCIENTGMGLFHINVGGDYRGASRHLRFHVEAIDEQGKAVADPDPSGFFMGGISFSPEIKPGEKHFRSLPLLRYCRFEKPGVYKLRVSHDLGWRETEDRKIPVAEATIALVMPTGEQARKVVDEIYRLPKDYGGTSGKSREPYADFSTLVYPVYLPILIPRAEQGCERALEALGHMPTPEATQALINLLEHKDEKFARKALQTLNLRLPDPQLEGKLHKRNPFDNDREEPRRWLVNQSWRAEFALSVRQAARKLLAKKDVESLQCGAFLLECLGEQEDLPELVRGLDHAAAQATDMPKEEHTYPRPRGACQELLRAVRMLNLRGVKVPAAPRSAGEMIVFASAIGTRDQFRPIGWEVIYVRALQHDLPYVREVALDHLPVPVPGPLLKVLPPLFAEKDIDVQTAACHAAEKSKAPELRESVLQVLASARERWLLSAAQNAAYGLDCRWDQIKIMVSRLDEEGMTATGLDHLSHLLLEDYSGGSIPTSTMLDVEAGRTCKAVWLKFLREHEKELKAGRGFRLADPALPLPEMFPKFNFYPKTHPGSH